MNNRRTIAESTRDTNTDTPAPPSTVNLLAKELTRLGIVSTGVAVSLLPLDLLLHRQHTQPGSIKSNFAFKIPRTISLASVRSLTKTLNPFIIASFLKNTTYSQRKNVESSLYGDKSETPQTEKNSPTTSSKTKNSNTSSLFEATSIAAIVGGAETFTTHYHTNKKTLESQKTLDKNFTMPPQPQNLSGYFGIYKVGLPIRATRNIATVGGLLAYNSLNTQFNHYMPENKRFNEVLASGISSLGFASVANFASILYKNQIIKICSPTPSAYHVPSLLAVGKNLYKEQGIKFIARGYPTAVVYSTLAYYSVAQWEKFSDVVIPKLEALVPKAIEKTRVFLKGLARMGLFPTTSAGEKPEISAEKKDQSATTNTASSVTTPRP
jgi:hypothetical protein